MRGRYLPSSARDTVSGASRGSPGERRVGWVEVREGRRRRRVGWVEVREGRRRRRRRGAMATGGSHLVLLLYRGRDGGVL